MPDPVSKSVDLETEITAEQLLGTHLLYVAAVGETDPDDFNRKLEVDTLVDYLKDALPVKLNKLDATTDPGTGDDTGDGYAVGSVWINVTLDRIWQCTDATSTAAVWKRLDTPLNNYAATTDPGTGDDTGDGYAVGSTWINLTLDRVWRCTDATSTAAVWKRLDTPLNNYAATTDPGTGDDTGDGYAVGSIWINVTLDRIWQCTDATSTAAVWKRLDGDTSVLNNFTATTDPGVGDDSGDGYSVGSLWVNVTADTSYICVDAASTAAVWLRIDNTTGGLLNKLDATTAPTTGDDTGDGYSVGSIWVNVTADTSYICVDATSTAAVWLRIDNTTSGPLNKLDATTAPTTGDDTGDGYSVGSLWVNVTADNAYICADATSTAAVWLRINNQATTLDTTLADVMTITDGVISADDAGADKLPFWDDSAGKMVYADIGSGLTMTGTTLTASGGTPVPSATVTYTGPSGDVDAALSDIGKVIVVNTTGGSFSCNIPAQATVTWTTNAYFWVMRLGGNVSSLAPAATVTLYYDGTATGSITLQAGLMYLVYRESSDTWRAMDVPVTLGASLTDVLSFTGQTMAAVDAGADKVLFWDDSAGKWTYLTIGSGLSISGTTITAAGGKVVNAWLAESTSVFSTSTALPADDTVPQSGEGAEILTKTITPSSTGNYLKFTVSALMDAAGRLDVGLALFKDSDASATLSAAHVAIGGGGYHHTVTWVVLTPVSSTASQTWKLRIGPASGTLYINQRTSGSIYSTSDKVTLLIEEVTLT